MALDARDILNIQAELIAKVTQSHQTRALRTTRFIDGVRTTHLPSCRCQDCKGGLRIKPNRVVDPPWLQRFLERVEVVRTDVQKEEKPNGSHTVGRSPRSDP